LAEPKAGVVSTEYAPSLADGQSILAYLCTKKANFDEALSFAMTALALLDRHGAAPERRLRPLPALFIVHRKLGAPAEALKYALEALEIAEAVGDRDNQARFLANVGTMYADTANYEAALDAYVKAIKVLEERDNQNSIVLVLNNMCDVSRALGDYGAAIDSGNHMYVPVIRASIGEVYERPRATRKKPSNTLWKASKPFPISDLVTTAPTCFAISDACSTHRRDTLMGWSH